MTKQEIKDELLGMLSDVVNGSCPIRNNTQRGRYREAVKEVIKVLEQEPEWIPVSERLPEENKTVIASTKYGVYPETKYTKEYGWEWAYESGADYWRELDEVEAWMPLPKRYKPESEE